MVGGLSVAGTRSQWLWAQVAKVLLPAASNYPLPAVTTKIRLYIHNLKPGIGQLRFSTPYQNQFSISEVLHPNRSH